MKCQGCGHDYPSTLTRCTICGRTTPRRQRALTDSRLIEFPRQPRTGVDRPSPEASIPAWRAELSERVRQIKAKRNGETASGTGPAAAERREARASDRGPSARTAGTDSNPVLEAALTRVRRANREAQFPEQPLRGGSSGSISGRQPGLHLDREATARALDPVEEPLEVPERQEPARGRSFEPRGNTGTSIRTSAQPSARAESYHAKTRIEPASHSTPIVHVETRIEHPPDYCADPLGVGAVPVHEDLSAPIDEIDPLDYLEAEMRKIDKTLVGDMSRDTTASVLSQTISGAVDLLVIAVCTAPFLAMIALATGSIAARGTRISSVVMAFLVSFFYLALTQCLAGRTFGMMLTNTRVVDTYSRQMPSPGRALARTLGWYLALAPAALGLAWAAVDSKRRGWQDLIAGTFVARDF
jgi:uncharacterized RDD family membrane protein YckC